MALTYDEETKKQIDDTLRLKFKVIQDHLYDYCIDKINNGLGITVKQELITFLNIDDYNLEQDLEKMITECVIEPLLEDSVAMHLELVQIRTVQEVNIDDIEAVLSNEEKSNDDKLELLEVAEKRSKYKVSEFVNDEVQAEIYKKAFKQLAYRIEKKLLDHCVSRSRFSVYRYCKRNRSS